MIRAQSDGRLFTAVAVFLVALAWLALLVWGRSPYGSYLHHDQLGRLHIGYDAAFIKQAFLFLTGWSLMTVAMMLPATLPLVILFRTITRARADRAQLTVLLVVGYLAVWACFGVVAHTADLGLHRGVSAWPWLDNHSWLIGAAPLLLAGGYQFTRLKYICLDKCRSPYSFIIEHWRGGNPKTQAIGLGIHHGIFCVGCCWSLMLLMFAVGVGNLAWMLGLAAIMGLERNVSWGKKLSAPLGGILLVAGFTVLVLGGSTGACAC